MQVWAENVHVDVSTGIQLAPQPWPATPPSKSRSEYTGAGPSEVLNLKLGISPEGKCKT